MIQEARTRWPGLPLYRMCQLLEVPRALLYRRPADTQQDEAHERQLVAAIDKIVLEFAGYGYRRATAQLQREGLLVNHKRVLSLMRREGLLCR